MVSADTIPSSPASTRFELASPGGQALPLPLSQSQLQSGGGSDAEDAARMAGQQQDGPPPYNPQSSTDPSHDTISIPTAPGQVARLAVHSALSHNPDESSDTQKADSQRTADLKLHSSAANEKQTAIDASHDVQTADTDRAKRRKRSGKVADEIDPRYALDAIPSLDDYIRYIELLQANWRDAPVIDIVYNNLSYIVQVSPEETRIPSIGRSFADFFRWISFQLPASVPLPVFKSHIHTRTHTYTQITGTDTDSATPHQPASASLRCVPLCIATCLPDPVWCCCTAFFRCAGSVVE